MELKKSNKNLIFLFIVQLLSLFYGLYVPKIIISNFGSEVNGFIASVTQYCVCISILELGIGPVVKNALYKPIVDENKKEIISILKFANLYFKKIVSIFLVYIFFLVMFYLFFIDVEFSNLFIISIILIISFSKVIEYYFGMTYSLYLTACHEIYILSFVQSLIYLLGIIVMYFSINIGLGIVLIKLFIAIVCMIKPIFLYFYVLKVHKININNNAEIALLPQKKDALVNHLAYVVNNSADVLILTIFSSFSAISIYYIYNLVMSCLQGFVYILLKSFESYFGVTIARGDNDEILNKFTMFEYIYMIFSTFIFSVAYVMIFPFIKLYTIDFNDVNYILPIFASVFIFSRFILTIRTLYSTFISSAGFFKEVKKDAFLELFINLILSIVLVFNYGLIGVAIGTLCATIFRTISLSVFVSKRILKRSIFVPFRIFLLIIIQFLLIIFSSRYILDNHISTYYQLIFNSFKISLFAIMIILITIIIDYYFKKKLKIFNN